MPRLKQVRRAGAAPEVLAAYQKRFGERDPVTHPGTVTGSPGNWWTVMANSPDIMNHFTIGSALWTSERRKMPKLYRELAILRTGFAGGSRFVFSQHSKFSRAAGLSEEKVAAVPAWTSAEAFDAKERAVLGYVDELVLADGRVQDATFERLKRHFDDEQILELTYVTCLYKAWATFSRGLRLEFDDIDERVTEVPAPAGGAAIDMKTAMLGDDKVK
jgi:alkylhydroperoxidase family enzyme